MPRQSEHNHDLHRQQWEGVTCSPVTLLPLDAAITRRFRCLDTCALIYAPCFVQAYHMFACARFYWNPGFVICREQCRCLNMSHWSACMCAKETACVHLLAVKCINNPFSIPFGSCGFHSSSLARSKYPRLACAQRAARLCCIDYQKHIDQAGAGKPAPRRWAPLAPRLKYRRPGVVCGGGGFDGRQRWRCVGRSQTLDMQPWWLSGINTCIGALHARASSWQSACTAAATGSCPTGMQQLPCL